MDVFGEQWVQHHRTIEREWNEVVGADDLTLVPGDLSWAMKIPAAQPDLNFLGRLPGRKVILKGNHDYWWASANKVRKAVPEGFHVVHGDAISIDDRLLIAGTRMWDVPGVRFDGWIDWQPNPVSPGSDAGPSPSEIEKSLKIYERELQRLEAALGALDELSRQHPDALRIVITHYPPCSAELDPSPVTDLIERHSAAHVVFGHLHAVRKDTPAPPFGSRGPTQYHLASCDFLDFRPKLIADLA